MTTCARLIRSALACATLLLAACETPTRVIDTSVNSFRPIPYSRQDTCPTQRAVAEHNAVYDTLKTGKQVTYRAPCEVKPPAQAPGKPVAAVPAPSVAHAQPAVPDDVRHEIEWHRKPAKPTTEIDADRARRVADAGVR